MPLGIAQKIYLAGGMIQGGGRVVARPGGGSRPLPWAFAPVSAPRRGSAGRGELHRQIPRCRTRTTFPFRPGRGGLPPGFRTSWMGAQHFLT